MTFKKPKSIIFLIVIVIISLIYSISAIWNYEFLSDYIILQNFNLEYLFFLNLYLSILLGLVAVWFLFKPKKIGFWLVGFNFLMKIPLSIVLFFIVLQNSDFARSAYIASREIRNLKINAEFNDFLFSFPGIAATLLMVLAFTSFLLFLLWRNKRYFNVV